MSAPLCDRMAANPLLRPSDVNPSRTDLEVECLLNPGAFRYRGRIGLLLRVGERSPQEKGWLSTPVIDPEADGGMRILRFRSDDPDLQVIDRRIFQYRGQTHLTTLSHLRLAWSEDGVHFAVDERPTLRGSGPMETFGLEDCRVTAIHGRYYLSFTSVSADGYGVGLASTVDWSTFERHGLILPSPNKDCAIFPRKIGGFYYALHRPSGMGIGGNYMWIGSSPDLLHWGGHRCVARTRSGAWDSGRVGAGGPPIETGSGWLHIYHGATPQSRYCLGAMLFAIEDPGVLLARSVDAIMEPVMAYETEGFFSNVVFTNGHVVSGDEITVYYGASDEVICGVRFSIRRLLESLGGKP